MKTVTPAITRTGATEEFHFDKTHEFNGHCKVHLSGGHLTLDIYDDPNNWEIKVGMDKKEDGLYYITESEGMDSHGLGPDDYIYPYALPDKHWDRKQGVPPDALIAGLKRLTQELTQELGLEGGGEASSEVPAQQKSATLRDVMAFLDKKPALIQRK